MKLQYKKQTILAPYCPICKEFLEGDNSLAFPYSCQCGIWESSFENPLEYHIKEEQC